MPSAPALIARSNVSIRGFKCLFVRGFGSSEGPFYPEFNLPLGIWRLVSVFEPFERHVHAQFDFYSYSLLVVCRWLLSYDCAGRRGPAIFSEVAFPVTTPAPLTSTFFGGNQAAMNQLSNNAHEIFRGRRKRKDPLKRCNKQPEMQRSKLQVTFRTV